jgi:hypothetical protein
LAQHLAGFSVERGVERRAYLFIECARNEQSVEE